MLCRYRMLALGWLVALSWHLPARAEEAKEEQSFVSSVASAVYTAAWPTATFVDWNFKSFNWVSGGTDLVVRLEGRSGFDDSDLWVDLVFEFRDGTFSNIRVLNHNAILAPPFQTTQTLLKTAADIANQYAKDHPTPQTHPASQGDAQSTSNIVPPPTRRQTHEIRVSNSCKLPVTLWVSLRDSLGKWQQPDSWTIAASSSTYLGDSQSLNLELSDSQVYFYGEVPGTNYTWRGDQNIAYGDRTLPMQPLTLTTAADGAYELALACPD
jgi:hypothetical protein